MKIKPENDIREQKLLLTPDSESQYDFLDLVKEMINDHPAYKIMEKGFYFDDQEQDEALELYKDLKRQDLVVLKGRLSLDKFTYKSLQFENGVREKVVTFTQHLNPMCELVLDPRDNTYISRAKLEEIVGTDYESFKRKYF